jgi:hypothetical protein
MMFGPQWFASTQQPSGLKIVVDEVFGLLFYSAILTCEKPGILKGKGRRHDRRPFCFCCGRTQWEQLILFLGLAKPYLAAVHADFAGAANSQET